MKKLMFVAALVAAGLVQAASLDWEIAKKSWTMSDGSKPNGATIYVFDTGATGYSDFVTALTGGTLGDSISASTITGGAGYLATATTYSNSNNTLLNNNYGKASGTVTVDSVGDYSLAIIVYDNGKYLVSSTAEGRSYASNPDDGSLAQFTPAKMTSSGWATYTPSGSDVPEPTSGLLLLVGGAMLALRRKQK